VFCSSFDHSDYITYYTVKIGEQKYRAFKKKILAEERTDTIILYAAIFQTAVCPHGHYCPEGTGHPGSYPCQAGRYRNNTLGHSGEACVSCPSGHYCDRLGIHEPLVCPQVGIHTTLLCVCVCVCVTTLLEWTQ